MTFKGPGPRALHWARDACFRLPRCAVRAGLQQARPSPQHAVLLTRLPFVSSLAAQIVQSPGSISSSPYAVHQSPGPVPATFLIRKLLCLAHLEPKQHPRFPGPQKALRFVQFCCLGLGSRGLLPGALAQLFAGCTPLPDAPKRGGIAQASVDLSHATQGTRVAAASETRIFS